MNRATLPYGLGGIIGMAMAGVDLALHDLVAKSLKIPVYKLIGGQTKEFIPCYATIHPDYIDSWRDRGFLGIKIAAPWGVESGRNGIKKMEAPHRQVPQGPRRRHGAHDRLLSVVGHRVRHAVGRARARL